MPPHVAILLVAAPEVLEERMAFRVGRAMDSTDVFADLLPAAAVAPGQRPPDRAEMARSVERLLKLQDRIVAALSHRSGRGSDAAGPRAVVTIAAGDLGQAVQEAVAAVEAMA